MQGKPIGYFIVMLATFLMSALLFSYPIDLRPGAGSFIHYLFTFEIVLFWLFRVGWIDSVVLR